MKSVWTDTADIPKFEGLNKDISTDVLVIGGGIAGILCAYFLQRLGVQYVLAEAKTIGSGITKKTTAVISAQHGLIYDELVSKNGEDYAKQYLKANLQAVDMFRELSKTYDFDFEEKPSYVYSTSDSRKILNEVAALDKIGFKVELSSRSALPFEVVSAVRFDNQAQMHPLKLIGQLSKDLNIVENTFIERIDGTIAFTRKGKITAKKIIIATHFPIINRHGLYFMKLFQMRSYVMALENAGNVNGTYVSDKKNGLYFRNYKDLLIVGGGDKRTGRKGDGFDMLRKFAKEYYPKANEKYVWATQDCMSLDTVPYIGCYSKAMPNVFVTSGFNEWGMTSSMVSASILSDMVTGKRNEFEMIFSPDRSILTKQLFLNIGSTLCNFIIPTTRRCSHLGCALRWNKAEHTWDCPCHGSRFSKDGKLIENPAMRDSNV